MPRFKPIVRLRPAAIAGLVLAACAGQDEPHYAPNVITDGAAASGGDTDTDGDDTADDDAEGSTGEAEEMMCGESEWVLDAVPPNVLLVLDKSGSMVRSSWDADANPATAEQTRWHSLHATVSAVVTTFDEDVNFGALLFPSVAATDEFNANACIVAEAPEVPVASANAGSILAKIPSADATTTIVRGATPATSAMETGLAHLLTLDEDVDRYMILVTDGAANCGAEHECSGVGCGLIESYDAALAGTVGSAFADEQVPTFVVGIDIIDEMIGTDPTDGVTAANTFQELNAVATAGGRAQAGDEKFYNARNEIELMDALGAIAGQVVNCTVPLSPEPVHPDFIEIDVGGVSVPRATDCDTEDGWVFVDPDGPYDVVRLCGSACDALADTGELHALYGCPPEG